MAEITMCLSKECAAMKSCQRHEASGTKPISMQHYYLHIRGNDESCVDFVPKGTYEDEHKPPCPVCSKPIDLKHYAEPESKCATCLLVWKAYQLGSEDAADAAADQLSCDLSEGRFD